MTVTGGRERFRREGFRRDMVGDEDENRVVVPGLLRGGLHETADREVGIGYPFMHFGFAGRQRVPVLFGYDERVV